MTNSTPLVILLEDEVATTLEPLSLTRPVWELRCGLRTLRQKIQAFFPGAEFAFLSRQHLRGVTEGVLSSQPDDYPEGIWINGSLLPAEGFAPVAQIQTGEAWVQGNRVVAFRGKPPKTWIPGTQMPLTGFQIIEAPFAGKLIRYTWELVQAMNGEIEQEGQLLRPLGEFQSLPHPFAAIFDQQRIFIGANCQIDPFVVLEARSGAIVIDDGVHIGASSVIEGPAYLGPKSQVKPLTFIRGSCLGEENRVGGEISVSIIQGYSNKQHGGFLGHSYIGSWCNLGSGTETSNLKNNYSSVKVQVGPSPKNLVDSGELFVGLTMGDHSKSAIGTVFNTGTVVGVACSIFGAGFPPRYIPSFHWGGAEKLTPYHFKGSLQIAAAVMARRGVPLTAEDTEVLRWVFEQRASG